MPSAGAICLCRVPKGVVMSRRPVVLFAIVVVLVVVFAASFRADAKPSGGNNKLNAMACQGTGYLSLTRRDGSHFANADACTSYAAMGGSLLTFTPTPTVTNSPTPFFTNTPV